jgi:hypothetical protein
LAFDILLGEPIDVVLVSRGPDPELHDAGLRQDAQLGRGGADVIDRLGQPERAVPSVGRQ